MDEKEFQRWLTIKIASGSASPEQVQAALEALGVQLQVATPAEEQGDTRESRPDPSTNDHPTREAPDPAESEAESARTASVRVDRSEELVKASAVMVHRALERAGNRLKTALRGTPVDPMTDQPAAAARIYQLVSLHHDSMPAERLLEDAWAPCEVFAADLGVSSAWLSNRLDAYARDLIVTRRPMSLTDLRQVLAVEVGA